MSAVNVEPKKVLQLINSMGYTNVSATELKAFTKDLKKLIKYEQKPITSDNVPKIVHAPENVINVTIIKEASPKKSVQPPTKYKSKSTVQRDVQAQTDLAESEIEEPAKLTSKRLLRLPRHVRSRNPKIVCKKGSVSGFMNGVLIRNTPTDLYQKYQDDWAKFKSYIPGENDRQSVRRSVRKKMQHKDEDDGKVYVYFPDETGDH